MMAEQGSHSSRAGQSFFAGRLDPALSRISLNPSPRPCQLITLHAPPLSASAAAEQGNSSSLGKADRPQ